MKCPNCGWENLPENKECLQCGAVLDGIDEIPVYPPRAKKKSKFTQEKVAKRTIERKTLFNDAFNYLFRYVQKLVGLIIQSIPFYSKAILVLIAGLIPGFIQMLQRRYSQGLLLLSTVLLLSVLFFIFITNIASNFFLYLLIALILYSSYDAVTYYYHKKNYGLTLIVRGGIILSSISICLLIYSLLLFFVNVGYLRIMITTDYLAPTFKTGDEILVDRRAYRNKFPQRGDIVAARYRNLITVERIIGVPGDEVKIENGIIFVNGNEISGEEAPLAPVRNITASISLPDTFYFLFAYVQSAEGPQLLKFHLRRNILGKATLIINPPGRRSFIQ